MRKEQSVFKNMLCVAAMGFVLAACQSSNVDSLSHPTAKQTKDKLCGNDEFTLSKAGSIRCKN